MCATTGKGGLGARPKAGVILAAKGRAPRPPFPVVTHTFPPLDLVPTADGLIEWICHILFWNNGSDQRGVWGSNTKVPIDPKQRMHMPRTAGAHATYMFNFDKVNWTISSVHMQRTCSILSEIEVSVQCTCHILVSLSAHAIHKKTARC